MMVCESLGQKLRSGQVRSATLGAATFTDLEGCLLNYQGVGFRGVRFGTNGCRGNNVRTSEGLRH